MKNLIPCDFISLIREKLMNFINFNLINQIFKLILLCFPPAGGDDGERHKHGQTRRFKHAHALRFSDSVPSAAITTAGTCLSFPGGEGVTALVLSGSWGKEAPRGAA